MKKFLVFSIFTLICSGIAITQNGNKKLCVVVLTDIKNEHDDDGKSDTLLFFCEASTLASRDLLDISVLLSQLRPNAAKFGLLYTKNNSCLV